MDTGEIKTSSGAKRRRIRETRITDADVQCPFYQWHTEKGVCCEWPGGLLRVRIEGRSNRVREQMAVYCAGKWRRCPWAEKLREMYDEKGETI